MKKPFVIGLGSIAVLIASLGFAAADPRFCSSRFSESGRISTVEGSDDWDLFGGAPPQALAEDRAVAAWEDRVQQRCRHFSARWQRARFKNIACEGAAGHVECTASASPYRYVGGGPGPGRDGPSFDCATATLPAERTICRSAYLSCADRNMARSYERLVEELSGSSLDDLKTSQRAFLAERNECRTDFDCLRINYRGVAGDLRRRLERLGIDLRYDDCTNLQ